MRQLPHFPSEIPDEALYLRRIYLPPDGGPREDEIVKLNWRGRAVTMENADAILREDLPRSGAHGACIETEDGGFIRARTVYDTIRECFGVQGGLRIGEKERAQLFLPELPRL